MDSDSDATIIEESEDEEAMDVEEIPLRNSPILAANPGTSLQTVTDGRSTHSAHDATSASSRDTILEVIWLDPEPQADQEAPQQTNQDLIASQTDADNDNVEDATSQSQSLLNVQINRNKAELSPEVLTKSEGDGQSPKKRPRTEDEDNEDDGKTCPICLDNWTNLGDHRICALKCGHLFGLCCIMKWFSTQKKKSCPTCKKKATRGDIRYIYTKKLIAMDVTELVEVKKQLNNVTEEKNRLQIELTKAVCREHLIMQQVEDLKKKVRHLDSVLEVKRQFSSSQRSNDAINCETVRLYMDKSLEICKEGGCRVLDCSSRQDLVVVSMKCPNPLFPGFGIRKIDISSYKPTAFVPLHVKSIRDLRFHPENPWLLSVSLDKTVKILDTASNIPIAANLNGEVPLWSCCWDKNNTNMLYVGTQQGSVVKFDIRQISDPVCTLDVPGDMSPVVSVASVVANPGNAVAKGGIISCKLNSMWIFENAPNEYIRCPFPLEGPFTSMTYENETKQLLVSTRSNARHPYSRHHLCSIEKGASDNLLCNTIHCFTGSSTQKYLSRSCMLSDDADYYVAAHEEANKSVYLWSVSTGHRSCSIPAHEPVLDLCGLSINNANLVATLTEKKLEVFKFV